MACNQTNQRRRFSSRTATRERAIAQALEPRRMLSLSIVPHFGLGIVVDPNASKIEATINAAIDQFEQSFSTSITVNIDFEKIAPQSGTAENYTQQTIVSYVDFRAALAARATTPDAQLAL